jgi:hypothetical protein
LAGTRPHPAGHPLNLPSKAARYAKIKPYKILDAAPIPLPDGGDGSFTGKGPWSTSMALIRPVELRPRAGRSDAGEVGAVPLPELEHVVGVAVGDGLVQRAVLGLQQPVDEREAVRQPDPVGADRLAGRADVAVRFGLDRSPAAGAGGIGNRVAAAVVVKTPVTMNVACCMSRSSAPVAAASAGAPIALE